MIEQKENINKIINIGINYSLEGKEKNDMISTYNKPFTTSDNVIVERNDKTYHCQLGDIKEAYVMLRNSIASKAPRSALEYFDCIQEVVLAYFGNYYNVNERIKLWDNNDKYFISDLYQKNSASGIERAMLAQNLLWETGIRSTYKISMIIIDGKPMMHAYNILSYDNQNYIFDASIPTVRDGFINPIICEISKDVYDKMTTGLSSDGVSVEVKHLNPLQNKEITIIYDANRENKYTFTEDIVKAKKR